VHQRFWMQPNVLVFALVGLALDFVTYGVEWLTLSALGYSNQPSDTTDDSDLLTESLGGGGAGKAYSGRDYIACFIATCSNAIAIYAVILQWQKWHYISDQSQAVYFSNYARAILDPLPKNATLLVNYDMQWTAVRYMQQCEGYRSDVTSINLSMMTYKWFRHKHFHYPSLEFPGGYISYTPDTNAVPKGAKKEKFTLLEFVNANLPRGKRIFLSGKYSNPHEESLMKAHYETEPLGLVKKFVPLTKLVNATVYSKTVFSSWEKVIKSLPVLPDVKKYPEETWEWTIGRDFKDRVQGKASNASLIYL
jgi:hypothetical protein